MFISSVARCVAWVLVAAAAAGCSTVPTSTKVDVQVIDVTSFAFEDARPAAERTSLREAAAGGALVRIGDDQLTPSGPALVKTWLQRDLGLVLSGRRVRLTRFTADVYDPGGRVDEGRFGAAAAGAGANPAAALVARALIGGIEGWRASRSITVRIAVEIDGKAVEAHWGSSPSGGVTEEEIALVARQALDHLVRRVREGL